MKEIQWYINPDSIGTCLERKEVPPPILSTFELQDASYSGIMRHVGPPAVTAACHTLFIGWVSECRQLRDCKGGSGKQFPQVNTKVHVSPDTQSCERETLCELSSSFPVMHSLKENAASQPNLSRRISELISSRALSSYKYY